MNNPLSLNPKTNARKQTEETNPSETSSDELSSDSEDSRDPKLNKLKIFSGNSHLDLSYKICTHLKIPPAKSVLKKLSNSEMSFEISEPIFGCDVYIIQSSAGDINSGLMELLIMINNCKMKSARRITAVIPYFPYMLDKKDETRVPISAKLISKMLTIAGANAIMTMDFLDASIHCLYNIPINNLTCEIVVVNWIKENVPDWKSCVLISTEAKRAINITNSLEINFALMHRGSENALFLIGTVFDKDCILMLDIADTCDALCLMAEKLKQQGAKKIYGVVTHGIFSGEAYKNIEGSCLDWIISTNTLPQLGHVTNCKKIKFVDISCVLAEAIKCSYTQRNN